MAYLSVQGQSPARARMGWGEIEGHLIWNDPHEYDGQ